jgi:EAL and modified HD-GYP domain-containing signal transduction protein
VKHLESTKISQSITQYVARQPIFNADKGVYAYELLYRDSSNNYFPVGTSDELATSRMFFNTLMLFGVEKITANKSAFVNLSTESLLADFPKLLDPKFAVIEIVERTELIPNIVKCVEKLKKEGYRFALDDYDGDVKWQPLLALVDYIKIEINESIAQTVIRFKELKQQNPNAKVIVERIETYKQFKLLKDAGCKYFQGYFFARPEMLSASRLDPSKITVFELLISTSKVNLCFDEIQKKVARDVSITARILKLANARSGSRSLVITSISQAVVYLGEDAIRQFVRILALSELGLDKPAELTKCALIRAKLISLLTGVNKELSEQGYLVGLLSLLDAILDLELGLIVQELGLDEIIAQALLSNEGLLGDCLLLARAVEKNNWQEILALLTRINPDMTHDKFNHLVLESILYADDIFESIA